MLSAGCARDIDWRSGPPQVLLRLQRCIMSARAPTRRRMSSWVPQRFWVYSWLLSAPNDVLARLVAH